MDGADKGLQREEKPEAALAGEYVGPEGLMHCRVCHAPRQCRIRLWDRERIVPCLCRCQEEERKRRERQMEEEERLGRIRHMRAVGIQEKSLGGWCFEVAEDTTNVRMAKRYVENWEKVKEENLGLLFWGDVGTGKTFLAACIANALIAKGVPVLMTNFSKILNQMGGLYSEERHRYVASLAGFRLLVIDDLGIERNTEYALEQVYSIIDERYKTKLPMIVTTNLTVGQLRSPEDAAHARIYSRVLEMCTPVHVAGGDRRKAIGKEKQDLAKRMLLERDG